jgi:hypothetical protein
LRHAQGETLDSVDLLNISLTQWREAEADMGHLDQQGSDIAALSVCSFIKMPAISWNFWTWLCRMIRAGGPQAFFLKIICHNDSKQLTLRFLLHIDIC